MVVLTFWGGRRKLCFSARVATYCEDIRKVESSSNNIEIREYRNKDVPVSLYLCDGSGRTTGFKNHVGSWNNEAEGENNKHEEPVEFLNQLFV